jgi:hypothetical protein
MLCPLAAGSPLLAFVPIYIFTVAYRDPTSSSVFANVIDFIWSVVKAA